MERSNILTGKELASILGGGWVPIVDENGIVVGWKFVPDEEDPLVCIIPFKTYKM